jgi:DUF1365 family protein
MTDNPSPLIASERPGVTPAATLYAGDVVHTRVRPRRHKLRYRVFSLLVDLDRLDSVSEQSRLFSVDRFNFLSLYTADFGPRDGTSVTDFIRRRALAAGAPPVHRIRMLAYPRILGFAFNPITAYFCDDADGRTVFMCYEVSNTFGEHHFYDAVVDVAGGEIRHANRKALYVSPFNTMEGTYRFSVRAPAETVFLGIALSTAEGPLLTAWFDGEKRPFTSASIVKLLLAYPFMTAKVVAGIHWEALRLWLKGVPPTLNLRRQPRPASEVGSPGPDDQISCRKN